MHGNTNLKFTEIVLYTSITCLNTKNICIFICVFNHVYTAAISPDCINRPVILLEIEYIFYPVEPEFLNDVFVNFSWWTFQASGALGFTPEESMWDF